MAPCSKLPCVALQPVGQEGYALAAGEIGGGNKLEALNVAADTNLPVVDGNYVNIRCTALCVWYCTNAFFVSKQNCAQQHNSLCQADLHFVSFRADQGKAWHLHAILPINNQHSDHRQGYKGYMHSMIHMQVMTTAIQRAPIAPAVLGHRLHYICCATASALPWLIWLIIMFCDVLHDGAK